MLISFSWTTPALLSGQKTVTRRSWSASHAAKFRVGALVDAYDRSPRVGGRKVATIRITRDPWQQRTSEMTEEDATREGIRYLSLDQDPADFGLSDWSTWRDWWESWKRTNELVYVLEFELVEVVR